MHRSLLNEIAKLPQEKVEIKIAQSGIGNISETDIKSALANQNSPVLGFSVKVDAPAEALAERNGIKVKTFNIIYKITEWLQQLIELSTPKERVEETFMRASPAFDCLMNA